MPTRTQIGNTLKHWIRQQDITPADLNERIGLPRSSTAVYAWLKGKGAPAEETRPKLAEVTGIDIGRLTPDGIAASEEEGAEPRKQRRVQRPRSAPPKKAAAKKAQAPTHRIRVEPVPPQGQRVIGLTVQKFGQVLTFSADLDSALTMLRLLLAEDDNIRSLIVSTE